MSGPILLILRLLLAASLYAFLITVFVILWRDVRQQSTLLGTHKIPLLNLIIHYEKEIPQVRHFTQSEITLGRDSGCECPLEDETISAQHAQLSFHHGQWWLEDMNSTNGTLLNNEPLVTPTVVTSGDEIGCGTTRLTIDLTGNAIEPLIHNII